MVKLVKEHTQIGLLSSNTVALQLHRWFSAGCVRTRVSWLLLMLVTASILLTPLTQHLWTWDRFLHGGQDFETSIYLILVVFCLAMVLARACKACLEHLFAALRACVLSRMRGSHPATCLTALQSFFCAPEAPCGAPCSLPLRI